MSRVLAVRWPEDLVFLFNLKQKVQTFRGIKIINLLSGKTLGSLGRLLPYLVFLQIQTAGYERHCKLDLQGSNFSKEYGK